MANPEIQNYVMGPCYCGYCDPVAGPSIVAPLPSPTTDATPRTEAIPQVPYVHQDKEHETTLALDKAKSIVCGDRARDYGRPSENHKATADLWTAYLRLPPGSLDERDVCIMNILQKASRDRWRRIEDNPVDFAGYAQNMAWLGDPRGGKTLDEVQG